MRRHADEGVAHAELERHTLVVRIGLGKENAPGLSCALSAEGACRLRPQVLCHLPTERAHRLHALFLGGLRRYGNGDALGPRRNQMSGRQSLGEAPVEIQRHIHIPERIGELAFNILHHGDGMLPGRTTARPSRHRSGRRPCFREATFEIHCLALLVSVGKAVLVLGHLRTKTDQLASGRTGKASGYFGKATVETEVIALVE
mmetsp:Transcript_9245/g.26565  ORF Transcript_9245/g.26565 Transcript_9245/m.26565 type:complete len:202 (-) Transcript_9245:1023-1628(-)